jgi:hypothetical protein
VDKVPSFDAEKSARRSAPTLGDAMSRTPLTAIVVLALSASVAVAATPVRTETSSGKDAETELEMLLAPNYKPLPSVHVDRCVAKWYPLNRTHPYAWHRVQGCVLSLAPADFAELISNLRCPVAHRPISLIKPSTAVPPVGDPFEVADVYFSSPPEDWRLNDALVYVNQDRTRAVIYVHYLVLE